MSILGKVKISVLNIKRKIIKNYYTKRIKRHSRMCGDGLKVNAKSEVNGKTYLGNNVNFNGMSIRGYGVVKIGDNFHSGTDCIMITDVHNYDKGRAIPYDDTYIVKDINIKDNVWLGTRVTVLGGVTIGEGAIIQAGSTVVSDIPDGAIAGGHPAKVFKYRDMEHYYKLKNEGKFH